MNKDKNSLLMAEKLFACCLDALFPCRPGGDRVSRCCRDTASTARTQQRHMSHYMVDSRILRDAPLCSPHDRSCALLRRCCAREKKSGKSHMWKIVFHEMISKWNIHIHICSFVLSGQLRNKNLPKFKCRSLYVLANSQQREWVEQEILVHSSITIELHRRIHVWTLINFDKI